MINPIQVLQNEHEVLLQAIDLAGKLQQEPDDKIYHRQMHDVILFLRNYTELYHFPKEEYVLYPVLRERTENMSSAFMHEICDNHEDFKSLMAEIENHYVMLDYRSLRGTMKQYLYALEEHIRIEDNVILSIAPVLLTKQEAADVATDFLSVDEKHNEKNKLEAELKKFSALVKKK